MHNRSLPTAHAKRHQNKMEEINIPKMIVNDCFRRDISPVFPVPELVIIRDATPADRRRRMCLLAESDILRDMDNHRSGISVLSDNITILQALLHIHFGRS